MIYINSAIIYRRTLTQIKPGIQFIFISQSTYSIPQIKGGCGNILMKLRNEHCQLRANMRAKK